MSEAAGGDEAVGGGLRGRGKGLLPGLEESKGGLRMERAKVPTAEWDREREVQKQRGDGALRSRWESLNAKTGKFLADGASH